MGGSVYCLKVPRRAWEMGVGLRPDLTLLVIFDRVLVSPGGRRKGGLSGMRDVVRASDGPRHLNGS